MIAATRTHATECSDGSLEFIVRVPAMHASELFGAWPANEPHPIVVSGFEIKDLDRHGIDPPAEAAIPRAKPETQTIEGAGGLDLSDFGSFSQSDGAREVFRARHMELISNPAFQEMARSMQLEINDFHSPRQIAQTFLVEAIKKLPTQEARSMKFNALYETYIGNVTIDIED